LSSDFTIRDVEQIIDLWTRTYNEAGRPDWSHLLPYYAAEIHDTPKTAIPHVGKAGQWSYSPTGVPTAILTGRLAADALL